MQTGRQGSISTNAPNAWHTDRHLLARLMRNLACLPLYLLCVGCALTPHGVAPAPPDNNLAVVFDIDGTLTTRVHAIRSTRTGAVSAVQAYADAGYEVIYLSARHPLFQWHIPIWLERHGFPEGAIHVTESTTHRKDHAAFKHGVLEEYRDNGWKLVAAYGDSTTDFEAYANAGIDRNNVFALKREGAQACEPGIWVKCLATWPEQLEHISNELRAPH